MKENNTTMQRRSGILVHPTSFPGPYGIGDLGDGAFEFIDFLKESGQTLWQCLPLGPTGFGDSPYQAFSAFAGQPLLISPQKLISDGLLTEAELPEHPTWTADHVDYTSVTTFKTELLNRAFQNFTNGNFPALQSAFQTFCRENDDWLREYALFMTLKDRYDGAAWTDWEPLYKFPTQAALNTLWETESESIDRCRFIQFLFFRQWSQLRAYAHSHQVHIIGDLPIFISSDSADVWAHKELFLLDEDGFPTASAGVPPDYFSADGQLWGNPLYDWSIHKKEGYAWWIHRIRHQLRLTDAIRIDHFRGFEAYWSVPAGEKTAVNGKWVKGPGYDFFHSVQQAFDTPLPIIAEDLGIITPEVEILRDKCHFPGMRILQFAFDNIEDNDYLPYNYIKNCICYTGTHDNDTTRGWYEKASPKSQDKVRRYMNCDGSNIHWDFIRLALGSAANTAIFPIQDVFGLDSSGRMNTPGTALGNWSWRYQREALNSGTAAYLNQLSTLFGRNLLSADSDSADIKEENKK